MGFEVNVSIEGQQEGVICPILFPLQRKLVLHPEFESEEVIHVHYLEEEEIDTDKISLSMFATYIFYT